jgi:hypothetical protein
MFSVFSLKGCNRFHSCDVSFSQDEFPKRRTVFGFQEGASFPKNATFSRLSTALLSDKKMNKSSCLKKLGID